MPPVVAILTDFGERDVFVGVMKGVLYARCPDVRIVDLCHGLDAGDVEAGAFLLKASVDYFPTDTIFLAVVDPGVGGARRPIALAAGGRRFVGPDNGILWPAAAFLGSPHGFVLDNPAYHLGEVSSTFHGRDIFAPVTGALAAGASLEALGSRLEDPLRLELPGPQAAASGIEGEVVWADRFGNLITNVSPRDLDRPPHVRLALPCAGREFPGPVSSYSAVPEGGFAVLVSSFGTYELAMGNGNAAAALGVCRGAKVRVSPA